MNGQSLVSLPFAWLHLGCRWDNGAWESSLSYQRGAFFWEVHWSNLAVLDHFYPKADSRLIKRTNNMCIKPPTAADVSIMSQIAKGQKKPSMNSIATGTVEQFIVKFTIEEVKSSKSDVNTFISPLSMCTCSIFYLLKIRRLEGCKVTAGSVRISARFLYPCSHCGDFP